jgi:hypothetical protein
MCNGKDPVGLRWIAHPFGVNVWRKIWLQPLSVSKPILRLLLGVKAHFNSHAMAANETQSRLRYSSSGAPCTIIT